MVTIVEYMKRQEGKCTSPNVPELDGYPNGLKIARMGTVVRSDWKC